ncbi:MAG: thioredoxin-dependent thiol peroxidase [candidate division Zixibacteria bacterium]|nr:thioredoxin-dependent thiol peroxidase [candidate division Zixibacteria bacterium]
MVETGDKAPRFCLPDKDNKKVCLEDFEGKWLVMYFYPKDNTSGCTMEATYFTRALEDFKKLNALILGVSPDSIESHSKFADKHQLKITLLSDTEHKVLEAYGEWQKKSMYGKEFWGVVRSSFLIDPDGKIRSIWRKVKVVGHVEEVRSRLVELRGKKS